ncbi:hypothetical protein [Mycobacterium sp.]|uniref:hypothetical protein n=1 Tax=Mycobacterium sp. TaxID=1785 RepID=UPI003F947B24
MLGPLVVHGGSWSYCGRAATDYWKWIGTHVNHPNTGQRVRIMDVRLAKHPKDGREIVAIVPANGPLIFSETTGHFLFEDN